jgi:hypothetical protein
MLKAVNAQVAIEIWGILPSGMSTYVLDQVNNKVRVLFVLCGNDWMLYESHTHSYECIWTVSK